jgi:hypothetical protein
MSWWRSPVGLEVKLAVGYTIPATTATAACSTTSKVTLCYVPLDLCGMPMAPVNFPWWVPVPHWPLLLLWIDMQVIGRVFFQWYTTKCDFASTFQVPANILWWIPICILTFTWANASHVGSWEGLCSTSAHWIPASFLSKSHVGHLFCLGIILFHAVLVVKISSSLPVGGAGTGLWCVGSVNL